MCIQNSGIVVQEEGWFSGHSSVRYSAVCGSISVKSMGTGETWRP